MATAQDFLMQRTQQAQTALQKEFATAWSEINRQFGPVTGNPQMEIARKSKLDQLHQQFTLRAQKLVAAHQQRLQGFAEVDRMAKSGMLATDPEEVKLRMVVPEDVQQAMTKPEKPKDTAAEWGQLEGQRRQIDSELKQFRTTKSGSVSAPWGGVFKRGGSDYVGGGLRVIEPKTTDAEGEEVEATARDATPEEIRRWARLTEYQKSIEGRQQEIMGSDPMAARTRLAMMRSPRGYGQRTFGQAATGETNEPRTVPVPVAVRSQTKQPDPLGIR